MAPPANNADTVLRKGADFLKRKGVEHPRIVCELLLSRLLNRPRLSLHQIGDQKVAEPHLEAMRRGLRRVAAGEPVQYVLGRTEFMGHVFQVDKRALIPRPETEVLVRTVLDCAALWDRPSPSVVDLGVGSGCILISLALARPAARYLGLDISEEAVLLAKANSRALGVADRVALLTADMADVLDPGTVDLLVSNPPYIPTPVCERLPIHIRDHEPRLALDGGPDGLQVVAQVAEDATIVLKPGGRLFLEIGDDQAERVRTLLTDLGFGAVTVTRDLADRDRVVAAQWG